ncbi:MAG: hypothetical protein DMF33_00945, partial [Verrucomicrobia bacterium]
FGLAKLLDGNNDLTRSLTTFGTAGFIAPEQAGHAAVDFTPVADVYSLGAVLFNVLAGRPPFLGSNPVSVIRQASETQAPKLRSLAPSLDRDLETICARCLERDPKARYQAAIWNAGSAAGQSSLARFHLQRGSGAGRVVIPNWLARALRVLYSARLRSRSSAVMFFERRSLIRLTRLLQFCRSAMLARPQIRDTSAPFRFPRTKNPAMAYTTFIYSGRSRM